MKSIDKHNNEDKSIVVFIREHMAMGGIEAYVYKQAKKLKASGHKVIWVKCSKALLDNSFKPVFYDGDTVVWNNKINLDKMKQLSVGYSSVVVVTFDMHQFAMAENFKRQFKSCPVHTFYFVPHFVGDTLYIEEAYTGEKLERVREHVSSIIKKMQNNGNIRYFASKHIEKMCSNYGIVVEDPNSYIVPTSYFNDAFFDEEGCRELFYREKFNLVTVSRFEFPHKGYILGLIKAYAELKEKYPKLILTIAGYGEGLVEIEKLISLYEPYIKDDIHLVGQLSTEQLTSFYNNANLNISVAGCCTLGARNGTLSIPARHYDYSCEVYGFMPESSNDTVSSRKGEAVIPYIERVLNMSEEEYVGLCRHSFEYYNKNISSNVGIEKIENCSSVNILSEKEIKFILNEERRRVIRSKFNTLRRRIKSLLNSIRSNETK